VIYETVDCNCNHLLTASLLLSSEISTRYSPKLTQGIRY
jgi:hypothetical protein